MFAATREHKSNNFSFFLQKKEQKHNLLLFCPCKKNTNSFDGMLFFFQKKLKVRMANHCLISSVYFLCHSDCQFSSASVCFLSTAKTCISISPLSLVLSINSALECHIKDDGRFNVDLTPGRRLIDYPSQINYISCIPLAMHGPLI